MKEDSSPSKSQKPSYDSNPISFRELIQVRNSESALILLIVPFILTFWVYYGKQADFDRLFKGFGDIWNRDFYSAIYEYCIAFLLMFWVPYFIVKMTFKQRLRDFGFQWGDARYGFRFIVIVLPYVLWMAYVGSSAESMQIEYPLAKSTMQHWPLFLTVEIFYIVFYLGWEFLFRGFMLFGLEKHYGAISAILIQTIPSAIVHIGKPAYESFGAIFAGLVFGFLAIRTRSMFYPLILHAIIGVANDLFITFRLK